jgi:hypothetical protein
MMNVDTNCHSRSGGRRGILTQKKSGLRLFLARFKPEAVFYSKAEVAALLERIMASTQLNWRALIISGSQNRSEIGPNATRIATKHEPALEIYERIHRALENISQFWQNSLAP